MSSAVNKTNEILSAEECRGFFELGTEPLVEHFTAVSECKTGEELAGVLKTYNAERLADLEEQQQFMLARLTGLEAMTSEAGGEAVFAQQMQVSKARLNEELEAILEQMEFVKEEVQVAEQITEQQLFSYKTTANIFLLARQKVLDTWEANYNANPLMIVDDIDHETIAVPVDGTDIGAWINSLLNKSLDVTL